MTRPHGDSAAVNADAAEIAKFEQLADKWWDLDGEFQPLHGMNPLRANYIDQHSPVAEREVLDVGCGGGILAEALAQRGARVTGLDMGEAPLAVARKHATQNDLNIDYRHGTAEQLAAEQPGRYDIVTCLEMLEHVPNPASVISACATLVKPGGTVYFSTINRTAKAWGLAVVGAEYVLRLLPKGTHDYKKFIRPSELASYARSAELQPEEIIGVCYNPFTKRFSLAAHDVDVNYIARTRKALDLPQT
ncbi:bifunctional 2-polyprenyl-6-hydroxyphenol methylase/3-demethylubiquinol 3-O-methyltransferase UbiG [Gilvimarinus polysaccharolyticus]|uniref:bifunctional 2-polyprenyl-6-hydroxyphenol methylase/3-demethylubiquinol 3-O-methyltransferase UbiG n=1 Tax=Gilvimarinus polysaccharolyticus TaxID=863921 RepID=UPI0006733A04|nr:bifunctional 2-polyprenyl-6-hydroxyphenol methylase/3-demethylubiquinol 3-O-methyltransferase UbiG [Gilvimarinus polysaccharolyticus]